MEQIQSKSKNILKNSGLRYTRQREILLNAILQFSKHFTADTLFMKLRKEGIHVSKATIYRTLSLFNDCGIICKTIQNEDITYYEGAYAKEDHDHLICKECGKIIEFRSNKMEAVQKEIYENYNFVPSEHQLIFQGICEKCRRINHGQNNSQSDK